ncbi:hypothetical protein EST38_g3549 [Candolleomyces aberdarensis]|uniref:Uncharacterized protein n=1 Tax=Candolleomyces aberdarensis TaxID=2316362 RepID=A0A4Q2DTT5_9AGAR|nr:hypothetical protein EST38_g3549 [Candolleomyces aberdarensis]
MDKASSVTAAFSTGKLPSTQQVNAFIDWLNDVGITQVEPSSNTELSSRGRILAGGIRQTLDAHKQLLNHKNGDNILQEAIWHLTEGDLTTTSEVEADKDEAKADIQALRSSLRTLISIIWDSVSTEGTSVFHDLMSLLRLSIADAAEFIEEQAGSAKQSLRQVDEEVQSGKRDTLGRDKERLEQEKDAKVAWQHGMDTIKDAGTTVIGASQTASSTVQEKADQTSSRIQEILNKIAERAQNDEQYKKSLDTIFSIIQKRLNATLDAAADPSATVSNFLADTTPEQHIPKAIDLFRTFVERLSNTSLDPFIGKFRTATGTVLRDPELKSWFEDGLGFVRRCLTDVGFAKSDQATQERRQLRTRWRTFIEKDEKWKANIEQLKEEWSKIEKGLKEDSDLQNVQNAHQNLSRDLKSGLTQIGSEVADKVADTVGATASQGQTSLEAAMEQATWFWQDLFKVYLPKAMSKMRDFPIPRTEFKDSEIEFVLENLDISAFNFLPSHVYIRNITDIDITTSDSPITPSRTAVGTLTHIRVQALQLVLDDVSFWYKDKTAGPLTPGEFTGLLGLKLPAKGIDLDLKVRLIPATVKGPQSRESLKHFHVVEVADVSISEDVTMEVKESNHALVTTVFKPLLVTRLREALQRTISNQLRAAVEWADGIAFDISKRQEVFEDTGLLGNGGSLIAAIWSEIGSIQRLSRTQHREVDVRATGTGLIVEQSTIIPGEGEQKTQVQKSFFAMGAEPQILSGEKRGPLGTGSEPLIKKAKRIAGEQTGIDVDAAAESIDVDTEDLDAAANKARELVGEVKDRAVEATQYAGQQVDSFRTSVDPSYGSLARFKDIPRLQPVGTNTIVGAGGDMSDFQYLQTLLDGLVVDEFTAQDGNTLGPDEIHEYLSQVMYARRSKMNPLWNSLIVGGYKDGKRFLSYVDLLGTTYSASTLATGYGAYIAQPLLRKAVEGREDELTEEQARKIIEECMRVLFYRDARSLDKYQVATITEKGATVSESQFLKTSWSFAEGIRGYGAQTQ